MIETKQMMTAEEAAKLFGDRWIKGNIIGGTLPNGVYNVGIMSAKEYDIDGNTGNYPVLEIEGAGTGEVTGNQIIASNIVPVSVTTVGKDGKEVIAETVIVNTAKGGFRFNTVQVNPQFVGTPITVLLGLQGKRIKLEQHPIKVQTVYPEKGKPFSEAKMKEVAGKLATKMAYKITVLADK